MNRSLTVIDTETRAERLRRVCDELAGIDPDDLRDALLAITEGAPAQRRTHDLADPGDELAVGQGGAIELADLDPLERIIGANNQLPAHFLEEGVVVQRAVARVKLKVATQGLPAGSGWGTGSLVSPSLLLTNNHVIPSVAFAKTVAAEFNYQFDFNGNALTSDTYDLDPDAFFYTSAALDFTVVRVRAKRLLWPFKQMVPTVAGRAASLLANGDLDVAEPLVDLTFEPPLALRRQTPGSVWGHLRLPSGALTYANGQFLNAVGHPSGRRKEIAVQDNTITGIFTDVIRYTTDTEPGSSGSPVFTNGWDLLVLHHAAGDFANGVWVNNEGMRIDRIVANLRANVNGNILAELGI